MADMLLEYKKSITKEELEQLPLFVFSGDVEVIEEKEKVEEAVAILKQQACLGFDTETRPAFHKGERYNVGLLQLATPEQVYLFRLNRCGFPLSLRSLLNDPKIIKVGVGIRDDLKALMRSGSFTPASFVDLQEYVVQFGIEDKSFSKLMAIIYQVRISKKQRVTNWEAPLLSEAQIRYAATDAWGALKMYLRLADLQRDEVK